MPGEVQLVDLVKRFAEVTAVDGINLEMPSGEFFSMLGPSGCGKTTTLRMIAGFEQPSEGKILLDGNDMQYTPPHKRNVNTVFQSYALFPHLNVYDNVAFGLRRQKTPKGEIRQRVAEALELVQLTGLEKRKPGQMSGGQQQRVALARALVLKPAVLLLDEPLGALDAKLRKQLQVELKALQQQVGITFVYVTHDQEEALTMSDRIAVFSEGRIEQIGTPGEIYERPANDFVAGFVGTSNIVERDGERRTIRPEKIRMLDEGAAAPADAVSETGVVQEVVYLGSVTRFLVSLDRGETLVVVRQNLETSAEEAMAERGRRVRLAWRAQDATALGTTQQEGTEQ
jgi:ABC-type Fe3+/spermidine/putrescine transport system ATPase subunit